MCRCALVSDGARARHGVGCVEVEQTISTWGRLDVLVNNAGWSEKHAFLEAPLALVTGSTHFIDGGMLRQAGSL